MEANLNPGEQVNLIVNNLAEKLGVAVERIAPITDQMLGEIVWANTLLGVFTLLLSLSIWLAGYIVFCGFRKGRAGCEKDRHWGDWSPGDYDAAMGFTIVVSFVSGLIILCAGALPYLYKAGTPTLTLLDRLQGLAK